MLQCRTVIADLEILTCRVQLTLRITAIKGLHRQLSDDGTRGVRVIDDETTVDHCDLCTVER